MLARSDVARPRGFPGSRRNVTMEGVDHIVTVVQTPAGPERSELPTCRRRPVLVLDELGRGGLPVAECKMLLRRLRCRWPHGVRGALALSDTHASRSGGPTSSGSLRTRGNRPPGESGARRAATTSRSASGLLSRPARCCGRVVTRPGPATTRSSKKRALASTSREPGDARPSRTSSVWTPRSAAPAPLQALERPMRVLRRVAAQGCRGTIDQVRRAAPGAGMSTGVHRQCLHRADARTRRRRGLRSNGGP